MPDEKDGEVKIPREQPYDPDYLANHIIDERLPMDEEAFFERRAWEIVKRLENDFAADYWKLTAWKLRAMHNWSLDRIIQHMKDKKILAGKIAVQDAIAEVAARFSEIGGMRGAQNE